jgi:hypothetical protein
MLTCIATGKSSWKSGGKKRSACFLENPGFPAIKKYLNKNDSNGNNKWELERGKQRNVCRIFQWVWRTEETERRCFNCFVYKKFRFKDKTEKITKLI